MLAFAVGALALHVSRMASPVMQQGPEPVQGVGPEPVQGAYARSNAPAVGRVEPTASGVSLSRFERKRRDGKVGTRRGLGRWRPAAFRRKEEDGDFR